MIDKSIAFVIINNVFLYSEVYGCNLHFNHGKMIERTIELQVLIHIRKNMTNNKKDQ